ncbi:Zinc finger, matrin-type 5 [Nesidiocoris tenuis]|uniref:Zinc finger, matrin-type 5 n=1 Tax=Nesidiocoris tenuis TaxID=355587 RepID=A0ABN7AG33_9HEMI|nr:Zinc finger, matrin-type 5 [Nesidiocoris tenuis]
MGKRYFCDYCQRSFVDDIVSRKKHLSGVLHIRQKKEYYALNRDLRTLIAEEREKEQCRRYRFQGDCPFGLQCAYTHYSEEELASFEIIIREEDEKRSRLPSIEEWLTKKANNQRKANLLDNIPPNVFATSQDLTLPPSLRFPTLEQMQSFTPSEWG